jgi:ABC-type uncharacterized transport system substrate-binding protein
LGKRPPFGIRTSASTNLARVATIWNSANPGSVPLVRDTEVAAKALGLALHSVGVKQAAELDTAFARLARERAEALSVISDTFIFANRRLIQALAAQYRVPAIYPGDPYVEAGGLMAYGPSTAAAYHRAAYFVDRILKGARHADLPVEQPTKFDLTINLHTAKALGSRFRCPSCCVPTGSSSNDSWPRPALLRYRTRARATEQRLADRPTRRRRRAAEAEGSATPMVLRMSS